MMLSAYRGAAVLAVSTAVLHMTQVRRTPIVRLDQHRTAGDDEYADYASPHVLSDMTDFVQSDVEVDDALPVHGRGHGVPPAELHANWGVPRYGGVPPRVRECLPCPLPNAHSNLRYFAAVPLDSKLARSREGQ